MPGRVLSGRAHVQDRHVLGQLVRASQHELTGQHVVGDHAGLVDGVLGLSVGRRVGEVQIDKVRCLQTGPHGGSDDVDATVHAVGTRGLRSENLPVGAHVHEDVHGLGTGEIARVLVRVRVHREVLHARGVEGLAVSASARDEAVAGIVIVVPCAQQACGYPTSVQCCGRATHQ